MSISSGFFEPVLGSKSGANGNRNTSSKLPPLDRNGVPPVQKPARRILSERSLAEEVRGVPPKQGLAPPPAPPLTRDVVAPEPFSARGVAGERKSKLERGARAKQERAHRLAPLSISPTPSSQEAPVSLLPEVEQIQGLFSAASAQLREQSTRILETQNSLQHQAESLEKALQETIAAREAEIAHSRKLAEAFARESARCNELSKEVDDARYAKQALQEEFDDLQIQRFRATELSTQSGVDHELLLFLKAENEALQEEFRLAHLRPELEEEIRALSRELAQNEPIMQELKKGLTEAYVRNTALRQQNDRISADNSCLREEFGIAESSPELYGFSAEEEDSDVDDEHVVSMSISSDEKDVSLRIHVPRSMVNQLAATC